MNLARIGRVLKDKYTLERLLGVGGMGAVYAATHRNGRQVAIKMLHPGLSADPGVRGRFLREGYAANKVKHPSVVAVLDDDIDPEEGTAFLVLELLDGETTESYAARSGGVLAPEQVLVLADRVLDVLVVAHAQGVIHRDIKPDNLFLTVDNKLKVFDFGIARLRELPQNAEAAVKTGAFLGTPAYMAPEQARGHSESIDARTDLWAVGATMYFLLSGRCVHDAPTVNEILLAAMTQAAPPLLRYAPHVPPAVAGLVDRALAFDPTHRWPDATALQQAVRAALPPALVASLDSAGSLPGVKAIASRPPPPLASAHSPVRGDLTTSRGVAGHPDSSPLVQERASSRWWIVALSAFALGGLAVAGSIWLVRASHQQSPSFPEVAPSASDNAIEAGAAVLSLVPDPPPTELENDASVNRAPPKTRGPSPAASPLTARREAGAPPPLPTPCATPPVATTPPALTATPTSTGVDWDKRH